MTAGRAPESGAFDAAIALGHVRRLALPGGRAAGSPADVQAGEYIRASFRALGLDTWEEFFPVVTGTVERCHLSIPGAPAGDAAGPAIETAPMHLCPIPSGGECIGPVAWLGGPGEEPADTSLDGRIVVWAVRSRTDFLTSYPAIAARGPLAIVAVWPTAGIGPKFQQLPEAMAKWGGGVPSMCIRFEDGARLWRERPERLALAFSGNVQRARTSNIIAQRKGKSRPEDVVIVGAHRDSTPGVAGAIDNGSGISVVLELARLFARRAPEATVRFVAWGAEKAGMVGSLHVLSAMDTTDKERILATISVDGVGSWCATDQCYVAGSDAMVDRARALFGKGATIETCAGYFGSDSEAFALHGVPGFSFGQSGPALGLLHTLADTVDMIDAQSLARCGNHVETLAMDLAGDPDGWRAVRDVPQPVAAHIRDTLERSGWLG